MGDSAAIQPFLGTHLAGRDRLEGHLNAANQSVSVVSAGTSYALAATSEDGREAVPSQSIAQACRKKSIAVFCVQNTARVGGI